MEYNTKGPHSNSGGVMPFPIETRFRRERERLAGGFTDKDRAWRKQFLQDQILSEHEPKVPEWYYRERFNPIRRAIRYPLNTIFTALQPVLKDATPYVRFWTGGFLMIFGAVYASAYMLKYNANDWTSKSGWRVARNKPMILPGQPGYPFVSDRKEGKDYYDRGFKNSPI